MIYLRYIKGLYYANAHIISFNDIRDMIEEGHNDGYE